MNEEKHFSSSFRYALIFFRVRLIICGGNKENEFIFPLILVRPRISSCWLFMAFSLQKAMQLVCGVLYGKLFRNKSSKAESENFMAGILFVLNF
ncbi:CLUMA_CG007388, isoform A [Clunio marinus]|uniref:CLUMA_CG007388, isoform A n=1 Tax=Clunio marinus TaxID=568069 RepID=A0A1J1I0R2_9DIPT|nr:CLUMA_CG007388, isoform A [Clunio marinus]